MRRHSGEVGHGRVVSIRYSSSPGRFVRNACSSHRGKIVKRVIKSHSLWLTLAYLSVLLLIAKGYA